MQALWPWLALAAAGALHGLNPANGWVLGACERRASGASQALRALVPIAIGHLAALAAGALAVLAGLQMGLDRHGLMLAAALASGLLLVRAARRWLLPLRGGRWLAPGRLGVALCSFATSTAHGAGWMLVPALIPVCGIGIPGSGMGATGSALLVLAAVAVHMATMLATAAGVTIAARHAVASCLPLPWRR